MINYSNDIIEQHIIEELTQLRKENDLLKLSVKTGMELTKCAVCGKIIEQLSIQRMLRSVLWCSRECFRLKPRKIVALEQDFGYKIEEILKESTRICGSIRIQTELLGVSVPYLYSIVRKYCGEDYIQFMAKYSTGKRRELYTKKVNKRIKKI